MSLVEGNLHIAFLVMDPVGLHQLRQTQDLHRTVEIFSTGGLPYTSRRRALPGGSTHSGSPAHRSTQNSIGLREFETSPTGSGRTLFSIRTAPRQSEDQIRLQPIPRSPRHTLQQGPFIVTRIKPAGVVTSLPWRGLSNLTTFSLCHIPEDRILLTYLLDFFETSPRLRYIQLHDSIPNSRNAPTDRMVSLPHLKELNITAQPSHAILLDHLSIPVGASLRLEFTFNEGEFSIPSHLPKSPDNLHNLSQTTATSLRFGTEQRSVHLSGPSGELYIHGNRTDEGDQPHVGTDQFFQSFPNQLDVSRSRWLAITGCAYHQQRPIETWALYKILRSMGDLRTLTLSRCANLPFILALDPNENSSNTILCSKLENLTFYVKYVPQFRIKELLKMAEARAASGASLSTISIVIVGDEFVPAREVFRLRKYVSSVEYRLDDVLPAWDALPPT